MRKLFYLAIFLVFLLVASLGWSLFNVLTGGFANLGLFSTSPSKSPERLTAQSEDPIAPETFPSPPILTQESEPEDVPPVEAVAEEPFELSEALGQLGLNRDADPNAKKLFLQNLQANNEALRSWINGVPSARDDLLDYVMEETDVQIKVELAQVFTYLPEGDRLEMIQALSASPSPEDQKLAIELFARDSSQDGKVRLRAISVEADRPAETRIYAFQTLYRQSDLSDEDRSFLNRAILNERDDQVRAFLRTLQPQEQRENENEDGEEEDL